MKAIHIITTALLLALGTSAHAENKVKVKADGKATEQFQLVRRVVIDLTKERTIVRSDGASVIYPPESQVIITMEDIADGVKAVGKAEEKSGVLYDLSGRKVTKGTAKGIYIKDGKKVVLK